MAAFSPPLSINKASPSPALTRAAASAHTSALSSTHPDAAPEDERGAQGLRAVRHTRSTTQTEDRAQRPEGLRRGLAADEQARDVESAGEHHTGDSIARHADGGSATTTCYMGPATSCGPRTHTRRHTVDISFVPPCGHPAYTRLRRWSHAYLRFATE